MVDTMSRSDEDRITVRVDKPTRDRLEAVAAKGYDSAISKAARAMMVMGLQAVDNGAPTIKAARSEDVNRIAERWENLPPEVKASIKTLAGI